MTPRDRVTWFALRHGANFVAVSFVRRAEDVLLAKAVIKRHGRMFRSLPSLEKPEAIENLDAICAWPTGNGRVAIWARK